MDARTFAEALRTDPRARVFIDRYGCPSTAHETGNLWVAHDSSTCPGSIIDEDRLFAAANTVAWRDEQTRVTRAYTAALTTVELVEPIEVEGNLERYIVVHSDDLAATLAAHPGSRVLWLVERDGEEVST